MLSPILLRVTDELLIDDGNTWPQLRSRYYLGTMPSVQLPDPASADQRRLLARVVQLWHVACIRLTGRIWGEYKRRTRLPRPTTVAPAPVLLPMHLRHLLS